MTRDEIYRLVALVGEVDRILHPLALEDSGNYRVEPDVPPPLPPTGVPGGTGGGDGPPDRRGGRARRMGAPAGIGPVRTASAAPAPAADPPVVRDLGVPRIPAPSARARPEPAAAEPGSDPARAGGRWVPATVLEDAPSGLQPRPQEAPGGGSGAAPEAPWVWSGSAPSRPAAVGPPRVPPPPHPEQPASERAAVGGPPRTEVPGPGEPRHAVRVGPFRRPAPARAGAPLGAGVDRPGIELAVPAGVDLGPLRAPSARPPDEPGAAAAPELVPARIRRRAAFRGRPVGPDGARLDPRTRRRLERQLRARFQDRAGGRIG